MPITLGCDPEFGFLDSNSIVEASSIITGNGDGKFGTDGCAAIAEIRPHYAIEPLDLVKNIEACLKLGYKRYHQARSLEWKAGSMAKSYSIGGHIHFGTPYTRAACKALDAYLAVPVLMLEKRNETVARRNSHGYGHLGDYRDQDSYGGFEYRALGSWITSPRIAGAVLSLAKCIIMECVYNRLGSDIPRQLRPEATYYNNADFEHFRPRIQSLFDAIKRMRKYSSYSNEINLIFKLIENNKTWFSEKGMKRAWGLEEEVVLKELPQIPANELWNRKTVNIY